MVAAERHQNYTIKVTKQLHVLPPSRSSPFDDTHVSDIQFAAHASDFVIAGSETTATTRAVTIHYLLSNPLILQTLTDEIPNKFNKEEDICAASTAGLKYLHAVCLEALQMYAPLPLGLPSVVPKGGALVDGYPVPEGFVVSTNPYAASLSPTNFTRPHEFIPGRWIGDNKQDMLDAAQPFSLGRRSCLGRCLAWLEMHIVLSRLIWRYEIERVGPMVDWEAESEMHLLWKKPELPVRLKPRFREKKI
ncbi:hypothetical protein HYALB_00012518 [Hymenoscyphus albidus]|uniref:Uncharacterized protein n=1 Tax=Hymenoscyphus albidus TaxID=595503 RepID=A0A9N9LPB0_9HELO|nr:hypothetical protein HYALB_00012518 [Hymenoscyphus albidus]